MLTSTCFSRFFSLLMSFFLLIAPLQLTAAAQNLIARVSEFENSVIAGNSGVSYVHCDKKLSRISQVLDEISKLDNDSNSLLHEFNKHISNGFSCAEYNAVLEVLAYAEDILQHSHRKLDSEYAQQLTADLHMVINQVLNGTLKVDLEYFEQSKGKRAPNTETDKYTNFNNDVKIKKSLSVTDLFVARCMKNLCVTDLSVVDATVNETLSVNDEVINNFLYFTDTAGGEYVGLRAPHMVPTSYTFSLPSAIPTANQVLRANSIIPTNLEWATGGGSIDSTVSKIIYVTKHGNDATGNGSFDFPYLTLSKAITIANELSSTLNPIAIVITPGIYIENNSSGPLIVTAAGVSILGYSPSSVVILPNTPTNNLLLINNTIRMADLTLQSTAPLATGVSLAAGTLSVFNSVRIINFLDGVYCSGTPSDAYGFISCLFINNGTALNNNNTSIECNACTIFGVASIESPVANIGINITGANARMVFDGGICGSCTTGFNITNNSFCTINGVAFRNNTFDIMQDGASHLVLSACNFELTNALTEVDITITGAGTTAEIIGCEFNGDNMSGVLQGVGLNVSDNAFVDISSSSMRNYDTAIHIGIPTDASSTVLAASNVVIRDCTTDILQEGSATLCFNASTASNMKININDTTNIQLAFFDLDNNGVLSIGSLADQDTVLIQAEVNTTNHPKIDYKSSLYSSQAIGCENPATNPTSWFILSNDEAHLTGITTNRTKITGLRLASDEDSPTGGTSALRCWDINKNASTAELSFSYQNSDIFDQPTVLPYTVMQLDGLNNQIQLPTIGTQVIFANDTNLYRSSAHVLQTDDNFIVGTLTPDKVVVTDGITNQLSSSIVTATELGYLSGITSPIKTQLDTIDAAITLGLAKIPEEFTITADDQTFNVAPTTAILILSTTANRNNFTIVFPSSPTNGQFFTILTTSTNSIGIVNDGNGTTITHGITNLDVNAALETSTGGSVVTYIYLAATNTWHRYSRG